ncbi:MAG TPA: PAS domain S-box protein [Chitinophagaceae bacterium]|nr:PAS domain S-box protein [Chitinophagaceae bacterium]
MKKAAVNIPDGITESLFQSPGVGIAVVNQYGKFIKVNDGLCRLLGYAQATLKRKPYFQIVAPAARKEAAQMHQLLLNGKTASEEIKLACKTGEEITCRITNSLVTGNHGEKFIVKIILDVSENQKYRDLLQQTAGLTKLGGFELDVASKKIVWTDEMYNIYEVGKTFTPTLAGILKFYKKENGIKLKKAIADTIANGAKYDFECQLTTGKKNTKWVHISGTPIYRNGKIDKIGGTVQDITTQKQDELQLERLSLVASETNNAVIITDASGKIEWVNSSFTKITGYSTEEVLGKKAGALLQGPGTDKTVIKRIGRQLAEGAPVSEVIKNYRKDGTPVWISMNIVPVIKDDRLLNFIGLGSDITEVLAARTSQKLKEALEQQQKLFIDIANNFPDGIIGVLDKNLNYIFAGGKEIKKLGIDKSKLLGEHIFDSLSEQSNTEAVPYLKRAFDGESVVFEIGLYNNTYAINAVPLISGDDGVEQILVVLYNITKRKKAEEEVWHAYEKQRELNELKSKFVSIASHEFRTPLSVILSSTDLILKYTEANDTEKVNKHIERIKGSVRSLTDMLNDFLSLEKIEEGKVRHNISAFNITEFCDSVVEEIKLTAKKGQQLVYVHEGGATQVVLDKQQLKHVLLNILSNAVKYSDEGKKIWLTSGLLKNRLRLTIKDEGIGIPEEDKPHLFETFFRANNTINIQGTGMGLHIVKRYLDMMRGNITFLSELNKGTIFTITLPAGTPSTG